MKAKKTVMKRIIAFNTEKRIIKPNDTMIREMKINGEYQQVSVPYANIDQIMREITPQLAKAGLGVMLSQEFADDGNNPKFRMARGIVSIYSEEGGVTTIHGPWVRAVNDGSGFDENQVLWGIARLWQRILLLNVFTGLITEGKPVKEKTGKKTRQKTTEKPTTDNERETAAQITQLIDKVRKARKWVEFSKKIRDELEVNDIMRMSAEQIPKAEEIANSIIRPH